MLHKIHQAMRKRGSVTEKTKDTVAVSLNKKGHPLYLKKQVTPDFKGEPSQIFIREMLEEEVILVDKEKITFTTIEVTKNDETVYFYGDLVDKQNNFKDQ